MSGAGELHSLPFVYDRSDFAALARLARPRIVGWLMKLVWVLIALAGLLMLVAAALGSSVDLKWVAALAGLAALAIAIDRYGAELGGWVQFRIARGNGLLREQVMTITPGVFRAESTRGLSEIRWSAVPRVHADEERLFVFMTKRVAYIVPRRAFAGEAEFQAFASAAQQRWQQHHRL